MMSTRVRSIDKRLLGDRTYPTNMSSQPFYQSKLYVDNLAKNGPWNLSLWPSNVRDQDSRNRD